MEGGMIRDSKCQGKPWSGPREISVFGSAVGDG